ncbi:MAG TPA: serine/threonine-protein kinase [Gemmatimonadales bacterium]|nr:serine/threonine-protein kinase [Gemmatimonadales bacterium]
MAEDEPGLAERLQAQLGPEFVIGRELGGGGMSRVFLARDTTLARDVVVKVLSPDLAAAVSVERFRREIMMVASLNHPNIVPVLRAGEVGALPYFLMPYIPGESLRARLARGPLSVRQTTSIMKDVARALAYAHERGIVHRDIKPDNILLSGDAATVTDFGVAKAIVASRKPGAAERAPSMTGEGITIGTPLYMAPEQAVADPTVNHSADLYALGAVAYEMLVGTPPFGGRSAAAVLAAHARETPTPIERRRYDVPRELVSLVMQCLEKEPERRPKSGSYLVRALDDTAISGGRPAVSGRSRRRSIRRWGLMAAVVALVLLAAWWRTSHRAGPAAAPMAAAPAAARPAGGSVAVQIRPTLPDDAREAAAARSLASELTTALSEVPGYRVASPLAAGGPRPLDVAYVLDGTVQRERTRIRVNLRFVDAKRDSTMWAIARVGSLDSLFALQDTLRAAATAALRGTMR